MKNALLRGFEWGSVFCAFFALPAASYQGALAYIAFAAYCRYARTE